MSEVRTLLNEIRIAETPAATFDYHLRVITGQDNEVPSNAICGKGLGWDTKFPIRTWGASSQMAGSYCGRCDGLARAMGYDLPESEVEL